MRPFGGIKTIILAHLGVFTALVHTWAVNSFFPFILMCLNGLNPKYQVPKLCMKPKGGLGVFLGLFDMFKRCLRPWHMPGP